MTETISPDNLEKSAEGQPEPKQKTIDSSNKPEILKSKSTQRGCLDLFLGFLAFLASLSIAIFAAIILDLVNTKSVSAMVMMGIVLVLLFGVGMLMWRRHHLRMFVVGYLIGLGLSALAFGLCITILKNLH